MFVVLYALIITYDSIVSNNNFKKPLTEEKDNIKIN